MMFTSLIFREKYRRAISKFSSNNSAFQIGKAFAIHTYQVHIREYDIKIFKFYSILNKIATNYNEAW